jgi:hypothetical protein
MRAKKINNMMSQNENIEGGLAVETASPVERIVILLHFINLFL